MSINKYLNMIASNGTPIWCTPWPLINARAELTSEVENTVIVPPGGYNCVIFEYSAGAAVSVALNQTVTSPTSTFTYETATRVNPISAQVTSGDVLHFISLSPDVVNVTFYITE